MFEVVDRAVGRVGSAAMDALGVSVFESEEVSPENS